MDFHPELVDAVTNSIKLTFASLHHTRCEARSNLLAAIGVLTGKEIALLHTSQRLAMTAAAHLNLIALTLCHPELVEGLKDNFSMYKSVSALIEVGNTKRAKAS